VYANIRFPSSSAISETAWQPHAVASRHSWQEHFTKKSSGGFLTPIALQAKQENIREVITQRKDS
jgi:hypothetical protein